MEIQKIGMTIKKGSDVVLVVPGNELPPDCVMGLSQATITKNESRGQLYRIQEVSK